MCRWRLYLNFVVLFQLVSGGYSDSPSEERFDVHFEDGSDLVKDDSSGGQTNEHSITDVEDELSRLKTEETVPGSHYMNDDTPNADEIYPVRLPSGYVQSADEDTGTDHLQQRVNGAGELQPLNVDSSEEIVFIGEATDSAKAESFSEAEEVFSGNEAVKLTFSEAEKVVPGNEKVKLRSENVPSDKESFVVIVTDDDTTPDAYLVRQGSITVLDKNTEVIGPEGKILFKSNTSIVDIEKVGEKYMHSVNEESARRSNTAALASWRYSTNITDYNKALSIQAEKDFAAYAKKRWTDLQTWNELWPLFSSESLKRQFKLYSVLGVAALPEERFANWTTITTEMNEIYSTGTVCDFSNQSKCDLSLDPELTEILAKSRDYDELVHVWQSWRDAVGRPMKDLFTEYIALGMEAAVLNGFPSMAEMWNDPYESSSFEQDVADLYEQVKPLYQELHAYVRRKLRKVYGQDKISRRGPIPAHVLGNMWAQSWLNIYDLVMPYPNKTSIDVTDTMIAQNYTPRFMFEQADDFFASLNMERVPSLFWENSVIKKPTDRKIVCHASAWDFSDGKDFRIKQCTKVTMDDFFTVHHEMGHIQYYMQYKHLPAVFRGGANLGFHEAVGDVLSLSVSTPKHLQKVGLLKSYETDYEADINFLMLTALEKLVFLPFGYLIDKWRWDVFRGTVTPSNYTCSWWNYKYELQGIKPPVPRTEDDFDPGAKYHVAANSEYIEYFASHVLQFQFHKALCMLAGEYDPSDPSRSLHQCDIYQSAKAGKALGDMLKLGKSLHWTIPLKVLTGTSKMDLSAFREYLMPLEQWLRLDNENHGEFVGWEGGHGVC